MQPSSVTDPTGPKSKGADIVALSGEQGLDTRGLHVLTLGMGQDVFAVETSAVHEVLDVVSLTDVPGTPPHVRGLINVRGRVVPVVDLKVRFGLEATDRTPETRIIVIQVLLRGSPSTVGLLADRVFEVAELPAASLDDVPRLGMTWPPEFIRALAKREDGVVVVMDIDQLFNGRQAEGRSA